MGESPPAQQTQHICIIFIQRRPNVFDVCPALYSHTNVLCLLGVNTSLGLVSIPAVIQSVGARAKGFELLTLRCRSSIYEPAVI